MSRPLPSLHLDLPEDDHYKLVEIHPVVLFSILDHYIRREEGQERVIGTLLGAIIGDGVVQITNCFTVPHTEKEQVAVNMEFHRTMLALHATVSPHEQIVGWYATGYNNASVLLHDFYWREMNRPPVHLLVDPSTLEKGNLAINCFYAIPVQIGERGKLQEHFRPLRYALKAGQGERTVLERMVMDKERPTTPALSDLDSLQRALENLLDMLNNISVYVKSVVNKKQPGDPKIGRLIEETLALIPSYEGGQFESIFTKGLQDVLMIVYLANLTRTHLLLAEQLRDQTPKIDESVNLINNKS